MKFWKQGLAAALTVAMLLTLLTACAPSGPVTPEQPGSNTGTTEPSKPDKDPGTGETGGAGGATKDPTEKPGTSESDKDPTEDENDKKTEEQKAIEATVKALNTVRAKYGLKTPLVLDAEASAKAVKMAQLQLNGVNGVYGDDVMQSKEYQDAWNVISKVPVHEKKLVGVGAYGAYPTEATFIMWANAEGKWKAPLVRSEKTTLVGVGVVKNTNAKTAGDYPYMVAVLTY